MTVKQYAYGCGITLLQGTVELLLFLPLLLVPAALALTDQPWWHWAGALPLCYAAGYAVNRRFAFRRLYSLLLSTLGVGAVYSILLLRLSWNSVWLLGIAWLLSFRGAQLAEIPWRIYFQIRWYVLGLLVYFIASLVFQLNPVFQPFITLLNVGGFLALMITLLRANLANVQQETLAGDRTPFVASTVLRNNRLLIGLLILAMIAVVWFRKLQQAATWLKQGIIALLQWLLNRPNAPEPVPHAEQPAAPPPMPLDHSEPAHWLVWLEKAAYTALAVVLCAAAIYALYQLGGRLVALLQRCLRFLTGWLHRPDRRQDTGYQDEVEQLMSWELWKDAQANRFRRWKEARKERSVKWEELSDNRERVRYVYRRFLRKAEDQGFSPRLDLTARETVHAVEIRTGAGSGELEAETLADLYDKARYSRHSVTNEELERLMQAIGEKKQGSS